MTDCLQYMISLRAISKGKGGKKTSSMSSKPATGRKGKVAILDLENSDSDNYAEDEDGLGEKQQKFLETLEKHLSQCQKCGPSKYCKIDATATHYHLTFGQRRGWATALVSLPLLSCHHSAKGLRQACGMNSVTLRNPPKGELFAMFHKAGASEPLAAATPAGGYFPQPPPLPAGWYPPNPYGYGYAMPPPPADPPRYASSSATSAMMSSDPPDADEPNPYPSVDVFLATLHKQEPRRNLPQYGYQFNEAELFNIDEIARLSVEKLKGRPYDMTKGSANVLWTEVKREMKRVNITRGR